MPGSRRTSARFGVPFRENPRIVRGLDYYGHTAFEFVTTELGAQGTVLAGGRYDGLVAEMGGPPTAGGRLGGGHRAAGDAAATSRRRQRPVAVIPVGEAAEAAALDVAPGAASRRHRAPRSAIAATSSAGWSAPTGSARAPR